MAMTKIYHTRLICVKQLRRQMAFKFYINIYKMAILKMKN